MRTRPTLPEGHGELLTEPPFPRWAAMVRDVEAGVRRWEGRFVAARPVIEVRRAARNDAIETAVRFTAKLGLPIPHATVSDAPIVMTGHQPELFHPGVWVKYFLLQMLASQVGGTAIDIVVDSDSFESLGVDLPCFSPHVSRCRQELVAAQPAGCFACTPPPSEQQVEAFCASGTAVLETLPAPAIARHFSVFCRELHAARERASNVAELITLARRRFEAPAGTDYLELPVTLQARGGAFASFVADIICDSEEFVAAYNDALAEYREAAKVRSNAQPFPDLRHQDGTWELPFWVLSGQGRETLRVARAGNEVVIGSGSDATALPARAEIVEAWLRDGPALAPKAVALTLFNRVFVADVFIHGVGGGGYDRVTDSLIRRYYRIEPPLFVVASLTMYLPLGGHIVSEAELASARERLNRLEHNPDALLSDVEFESVEEFRRATELAARKAALVSEIGGLDADKKALGRQIREVNASLAELLAPVRDALAAEVVRLEELRAASAVLTDRTYPFCLWSPLEVQDKVG